MEVYAELNWWAQNLHLAKEKATSSTTPQLLIASDASLEGWGRGRFVNGSELGDHGHH